MEKQNITDINAQDKDGWTPLMEAVLSCDLELTEQLLEQGAKPDIENNTGETPLWLAIEEEHLGMVELLCGYANINFRTNEGATALARAMYQKNTDIISLLKEKGGVDSGPIPSMIEQEAIYLHMCKEKNSRKKVDVQRTLRTIGLTCFVSCFDKLVDKSISVADLVEVIKSDTVSESSARTKAYAGRKIIKTGNAIEALTFAAESTVIDHSVARVAKQILLRIKGGESWQSTPETDLKPKSTSFPELVPSKSIWNSRIAYQKLNARQQENYNMMKLGSVLADYGFNLIKLNDDWQGADCIASHIDGDTYLKVQLKGRLTIDKKYLEKDIYIAFRDGEQWYLYPHDDLVDKLHHVGIAVNTSSWTVNGHYSWPTLSSHVKALLQRFSLS